MYSVLNVYGVDSLYTSPLNTSTRLFNQSQ